MSFPATSITGHAITGALWTSSGGVSDDFSVSVSPSSKTVDAGESTSYVITVGGAFSGTIDLSVPGLPSGVTAVISPTSLTGPGTATLTLYTSDGTPLGTWGFTVSGTGSDLTRHGSAALAVSGAAGGSVQVLIDGLDRSGALYYAGQNNWRTYRGQRATCTLSFIIRPGSTFAPTIGQFLEIYDGDTRVWVGTIDQVEITWIGDAGYHVAAVTGVGLEALFDGVQLDKVQYTSAITPITCGGVVTDLFGLASIPIVTLGTISDGPDVVSLSVTDVKQALDTLALCAGFIWYIDPQDAKLYFQDASDRAADWELGDSPDTSANGAIFESFDWKQSRQDFADTWVSQLPGSAIPSQTKIFAGDGTTTVWTLDSVPQFILSADISPVGTGATTSPLPWSISWVPGTNKVTATPALSDGWELIVKWLDPGQVQAQNTYYGANIGHRARRYTKTCNFTADGVLQEATAALAQYALLPAELQFMTDKPGLAIGRKLTIDVSYPAESSGLLNGDWQITEIDGAIVTGLDSLDEPFGHWRYTVYLVNFNATAIFPGDGSTTDFSVPTGTAVSATVSNGNGAPSSTVLTGGVCTVTPPPPDGSTVAVQYRAGVNPTTQPWQGTLEGMAPTQGLPSEPSGAAAGSSTSGGAIPAQTGGNPQYFIRTLTLRDLTVGDDIASTPPSQHAGIGTRILGVVKKELTSDLTVRFNLAGQEVITVTIPALSSVEDTIEWPLITGSPAVAVAIDDKTVWTADILESDGQIVSNPQDMIAQFTIEWEFD